MEKQIINIIMPCFNEAEHLPCTITCILKYTQNANCIFRLIVMDNGSTDGSKEIVKRYGVENFHDSSVTIGGIRNNGIKKIINGEIIAFLDADIEVTQSWVDAVCRFSETAIKNKMIITGYPYMSSKKSWIEKHWFSGRGHSKKYINSGNLVTTKNLFYKIGGFNENLKTGEDWDFCIRAKKAGARIELDDEYKVYHHGYPKTLKEFFKREMWHGIGDCIDFKKYVKSKLAVLSTLFIFSGVISMFFLTIGKFRCSGAIFFVFTLFPIILISIRRSKNIKYFPGNILIASTYLSGRFASIVVTITQKFMKKAVGNSKLRWR